MKQNTIKIAIAILAILGFLLIYTFNCINMKDHTAKTPKSIAKQNKKEKDKNNFIGENSEKKFYPKSGPIVDQTISSNKNEQSTDPSKIKIKLTLIDGNENKPLENYDINLIVSESKDKRIVKNQKLKTDKNGNIPVELINFGEYEFEIKANTFIPQIKNLTVSENKNELTIILIRGGIIELKVFNEEGIKIDAPITATIIEFSSKKNETFLFDGKKEFYCFTEVPIGLINIKFKSAGYIETDLLQTYIRSGSVFKLEIKMQKIKFVKFDIEAIGKPESIILEMENWPTYLFGVNYVYRDSILSEVLKNENGLYEFNIDCKLPVKLSIYTNGFVTYPITIIEGTNYYVIKLIKNEKKTIQVKDEVGKPVFGAKIKFENNDRTWEETTNIIGVGLVPDIELKDIMKISVSKFGYHEYIEENPINNFQINIKEIILKAGVDTLPFDNDMMDDLEKIFEKEIDSNNTKANLHDLRKIVFTGNNDNQFANSLMISEFVSMTFPMDVIIDEKKEYFLEIPSNFEPTGKYLLFEPYGYEMVIIGPYENLMNIPKEFQIELKKPQEIKIKIIEDKNKMPMPFVKVSLFIDKLKLFSASTNRLGEVVFPSINKNFTIEISSETHCETSIEFEAGSKNLEIRLLKNCKLNIIDSSNNLFGYDFVDLNPITNKLNVPNSYLHERKKEQLMISNIAPGEYTISLIKNNGKPDSEELEFPNKIYIEEDKILEINLEKLIKENKK